MQSIGVDLYFDMEGNAIVVPMLQDPIGFGRLSCKFIKLQKGYAQNELAEAIMRAIDISVANETEDNQRNFWTEATGIKGYATFSKKYKCISVDYILEEEGYTVTAQKRYKDGSYGYEQEDIPLRVKEYAGRPSVEAIAEQVLEALKIE